MDDEIGSRSVTAKDVHQLLIVHLFQETDSRSLEDWKRAVLPPS